LEDENAFALNMIVQGCKAEGTISSLLRRRFPKIYCKNEGKNTGANGFLIICFSFTSEASKAKPFEGTS
jgi:hypothetical protein